jgi:HEAT repeat protein
MNKARLLFFVIILVLFLIPVSPTPAGRGQQPTRKSAAALIYELKHPDADVRKQAAALIGQNMIREAVPALVEATSDTDDSVRLEVVRALVRINDVMAIPSYIRLTKDPSKSIQEKSIEGLVNAYVFEEGGFIRGVQRVANFMNPWSDDYNALTVEPYMPVKPEVITALSDLLQSEDAGLRKRAATALGILRAVDALPAITDTLAREDDDGVKVELIRALYKIGDRDAAKAVVPLIRDSDKGVHDEAIITVGRLRVKDGLADIKALYESGVEERKKFLGIFPLTGKDDLVKKLFEALSYLGDPSCQDIFRTALDDERVFYRRYAAEGYARIGDKDQVSMIGARYLREKSDEVKLAFSFALYRMGRAEHLIELANGGEQGCYYLLELPPSEIPKLFPLLASEKDSAKIRLLDVIGLKGDASALPEVERYASHANADVASAANLAMRRLRGRWKTAD